MAVSETQIDLAWQEFTNTGGSAITGYQVQVSEDGGTTFTDLHTTSGAATLTYEHTGLSAGTEYHYQVAAINSEGTGAYAPTSATTQGLLVAPVGLTAMAVSDTEIDLSWTAPTSTGGITAYALESSTDGGTTFTDLHTTFDAATLTYEHTGLSAGTEYHYQVAAINSYGIGAYASTSATTHDVPAAVDDLSASAASSTQIDLSWTAPNDGGSPLTGYTLQYNKTGDTAFGESVTGIAGDATSYSHTSLDAGTEYTYRVVAINDVGNSGPSNEVSATTNDVSVAPAEPTGLMATVVSDGEVTLSWTVPSDGGSAITSYKIKQATAEC